ncbi:hypothetical protein [Rubritalea sp.]|uniref:hypothetical protein n=1 Tax=Rubritalea sp. TaxID=2109375 RepID=UPI003EF6BDBA
MLRKKDPLRGHKIIRSTILSGLSLIAFTLCQGGKAFFCFAIVVLGLIHFIKAWNGKPVQDVLSKVFEHPERTYKG